MCGIAGIINLADHQKIDEAEIERMIAVQKHRGPDEFGMLIDGNAGFGHARLSIIDLSSGSQPMSNEEGSLWIVFNGEIFNYIELKEELVKKGHQFRTTSDTEVIIHLFEEHGLDCLQYLNGQFAFAIWDNKKKELLLARDRVGISPLYYAGKNKRFYFASEIKSIFATGAVEREIDPLALDELFTLWHTVAPRTAFKGIFELQPGHFMTVKGGEISVKKYWDLSFSEKDTVISEEEASRELKRLLVDATRLRLRADVPVGAYLSGGLDSSVTTALIRHYTNSPLETFSVAFEDKAFDESRYQQEMAKALATTHHEIKCSYKDIGDNFPDLVWHTEKPLFRTAPTPLFLLSKLVRSNHFKVVLTGEGADEVLGGYDIFKEVKIREFCAKNRNSNFRPSLLKKLYPYLPAFQSQSHAYMNAFFNDKLLDVNDSLFSHRPRWQTTSKIKTFYSQNFKNEIGLSSPEITFGDTLDPSFSRWKPFERAQYLESKGLLPGYLLSSQGDRVLMAHSIEGRFPFLDHRVMEFASKLPYTYKMKVLNEKYLLKKAMKKYLPKEITKRTKQPYMAPDSKSFFSKGAPDYVSSLLSEESIDKYGYFNSKPVNLLVRKCKKGAVTGFRDNMALVGILSTQLLHERFIENFRIDWEPLANVRKITI
ncbi:MAG: asparagine synthase (glutamine-hydrolyzing) [Deltaproteobacteria bacterium]|nr:asparagine synthase (glutamine-hydrolyzing) [Deltaproteobacteria bacterium]